jgi:hypothetical protein
MRKLLVPCVALLLGPSTLANFGANFDFNYQEPSNQNQKQKIVKHVDQDIYGEHKFKLKKLFGLNRQELKNSELLKVVVHADIYSSRSKARLVINNRPSRDVVHLNEFENKFVFKIPNNIEELRSLQLEMRGRIYVQKIVAVLKKNQGRTQTLTKDLYTTLQGQSTINATRKLALQKQSGKKLMNITLTGDSAKGKGTAQLLIDGYPVGQKQVLSKFGSTLKFNVPKHSNIIGQDLLRVKIALKGNIYVESISAKVKGQGRAPINRSHNEDVFIDLSGNKTVYISDILQNTTRSDQNKAVKKVLITMSSKKNRGKAKVCSGFECSNQIALSYMAQDIALNTHGALLEDISVQTRGQATIETIKVIFE